MFQVELAFNVPFVRIPVKKTLDSAKGGLANINLGGIALGGAVVVAAVGIIPAAYWLLSSKTKTFTSSPYRSKLF